MFFLYIKPTATATARSTANQPVFPGMVPARPQRAAAAASAAATSAVIEIEDDDDDVRTVH